MDKQIDIYKWREIDKQIEIGESRGWKQQEISHRMNSRTSDHVSRDLNTSFYKTFTFLELVNLPYNLLCFVRHNVKCWKHLQAQILDLKVSNLGCELIFIHRTWIIGALLKILKKVLFWDTLGGGDYATLLSPYRK